MNPEIAILFAALLGGGASVAFSLASIAAMRHPPPFNKRAEIGAITADRRAGETEMLRGEQELTERTENHEHL